MRRGRARSLLCISGEPQDQATTIRATPLSSCHILPCTCRPQPTTTAIPTHSAFLTLPGSSSHLAVFIGTARPLSLRSLSSLTVSHPHLSRTYHFALSISFLSRTFNQNLGYSRLLARLFNCTSNHRIRLTSRSPTHLGKTRR